MAVALVTLAMRRSMAAAMEGMLSRGGGGGGGGAAGGWFGNRVHDNTKTMREAVRWSQVVGGRCRGSRGLAGDASKRRKTEKTKNEQEEEEGEVDVQKQEGQRGEVNAAGVDMDRAEDAMKASQIATRMMFPWERRQFDGGRLTWWERAYWAAFAPTLIFVVGYALMTNDWEDLRQGRLSPTFEERAMMEADARRRARLERLEAERRQRLHAERREFGRRKEIAQSNAREVADEIDYPSSPSSYSVAGAGGREDRRGLPGGFREKEDGTSGTGMEQEDDFEGLDPWEIDKLAAEQARSGMKHKADSDTYHHRS